MHLTRLDTSPARRLVIAALLFAMVLVTACSGGARINVEVDPETGQGSVEVLGSGSADGGEGDSSADQDSRVQASDAVIFATVVALFLGLLAIVISVARRPRRQ